MTVAGAVVGETAGWASARIGGLVPEQNLINEPAQFVETGFK